VSCSGTHWCLTVDPTPKARVCLLSTAPLCVPDSFDQLHKLFMSTLLIFAVKKWANYVIFH